VDWTGLDMGGWTELDMGGWPHGASGLDWIWEGGHTELVDWTGRDSHIQHKLTVYC
jgi:hypothetical protein